LQLARSLNQGLLAKIPDFKFKHPIPNLQHQANGFVLFNLSQESDDLAVAPEHESPVEHSYDSLSFHPVWKTQPIENSKSGLSAASKTSVKAQGLRSCRWRARFVKARPRGNDTPSSYLKMTFRYSENW
jgi:hypothetical protein